MIIILLIIHVFFVFFTCAVAGLMCIKCGNDYKNIRHFAVF